jgi:hypothetical protein
MEVKYTGVCWKHHLSENFENGTPTHPNGAGAGGTVFTDYDKMIEYLKKDGRHWHIAEILLENEPLIFEFDNDWMATIPFNKLSNTGFKPLILWKSAEKIQFKTLQKKAPFQKIGVFFSSMKTTKLPPQPPCRKGGRAGTVFLCWQALRSSYLQYLLV